MDKNIQKDYMIRKAWGMSATIDLKECGTESIRSAAYIQQYVIQLCKHIEVLRCDDAKIVHCSTGNNIKGMTLVQLIEDGSIVAHFNFETGDACIGIFSCSPFSPLDAAEFSEGFFEAKGCEVFHQFKV